MSERIVTVLPPEDVLKHVVDVHCHPTDSDINENDMEALRITLCAMATRQDDQALVADLAEKYPDRVIPCFGEYRRSYYSINRHSRCLH